MNGEGTGGGPGFFVSFDSGSFHANLGCNDMNGEYRLSGAQLLPGIARMTERGCVAIDPAAPDPMRFEDAGWRVLGRAMDVQFTGGILSLSNRAGSLTLRRLP